MGCLPASTVARSAISLVCKTRKNRAIRRGDNCTSIAGGTTRPRCGWTSYGRRRKRQTSNDGQRRNELVQTQNLLLHGAYLSRPRYNNHVGSHRSSYGRLPDNPKLQKLNTGARRILGLRCELGTRMVLVELSRSLQVAGSNAFAWSRPFGTTKGRRLKPATL